MNSHFGVAFKTALARQGRKRKNYPLDFRKKQVEQKIVDILPKLYKMHLNDNSGC
jgi:hypothetical protein